MRTLYETLKTALGGRLGVAVTAVTLVTVAFGIFFEVR